MNKANILTFFVTNQNVWISFLFKIGISLCIQRISSSQNAHLQNINRSAWGWGMLRGDTVSGG